MLVGKQLSECHSHQVMTRTVGDCSLSLELDFKNQYHFSFPMLRKVANFTLQPCECPQIFQQIQLLPTDATSQLFPKLCLPLEIQLLRKEKRNALLPFFILAHLLCLHACIWTVLFYIHFLVHFPSQHCSFFCITHSNIEIVYFAPPLTTVSSIVFVLCWSIMANYICSHTHHIAAQLHCVYVDLVCTEPRLSQGTSPYKCKITN